MRCIFMVGTMIALAATTGCTTGTAVTGTATAAATVPLTIRSAKGAHRFNVEVASTVAEQARGLMFRPHIDPDGGMIFPMKPPRYASFWMKNTVSSLDLLFIRPDGTIARIAADAVPYSLDPIESGEPIAAVLELAGGRAAQLGIAEDDKVVWTH
ncbi:DUF192 domain-containing protein [Sphingomonas sp.]|uniref:DUF192 domain-containing protein n=1 Tax=Sphingomonas sp. TaxID=28214 RepID=UPI0025F87AB4|nr:DUF192 domain-containing protein [Sphingomonas sp.]